MSEVPPEVVARAQSGDAEAFRVIFLAHIHPVRRFLGDLLRDSARADEAAQETFVRAHTRLATLSAGERLSAWIFGIARLVAREEQRKTRRDWQTSSNHAAGEVGEPGDFGEPTASALAEAASTIDRASTPEGALLSAEADRALAVALAQLSDERREVLLLRIDHQLGYPEIAQAVGWPLHKVKNEIHRARLQLRLALAGFLAGEQS